MLRKDDNLSPLLRRFLIAFDKKRGQVRFMRCLLIDNSALNC